MLMPWKSLVYYFIRSLIHRPAVCFAEENLRSPSILAMSNSSKHIIQILQLLDERRLCLSISINRKELVFLSGLGLLWQTLGLKRDSKLVKESQKLLANVVEQLEQESPASASEFTSLASTLVFLDTNQQGVAHPKKQSQDMEAPTQKPSRSPKKQLQSLKSRFTSSGHREESSKHAASRRNTISGATPPILPQSLRSPSWTSLPPPQHENISAPQFPSSHGRASLDLGSDPRLASSTLGYDYQRTMSASTPSDATNGNGAITMADWEYVLSDMDRGYSNIFTGIYGGKECGEDAGPFASITAEYAQKQNDGSLSIPPPTTELHDLSPQAWSASSGDFAQCQERAAQSVLSYSGESMGSSEDTNLHSFADASVHPDDIGLIDPFQAITMPAEGEMDEFALVNGWDRQLAV